jgi:hypothetical protein
MSNILNYIAPGNMYPQSILRMTQIRQFPSEKYREFYTYLDNRNQLLTHLELNIMRGNVTTVIVDIISLLRRTKSYHKLPECLVEYLKTNVKQKRYKINKRRKYATRSDSLIFEYLMRELKLTLKPQMLKVIGPKSNKFGCKQISPLL